MPIKLIYLDVIHLMFTKNKITHQYNTAYTVKQGDPTSTTTLSESLWAPH